MTVDYRREARRNKVALAIVFGSYFLINALIFKSAI
jgi:hypothetical protein